MIRLCDAGDTDTIYKIINEAAQAYAGVIPEDRYQRPYMPVQELEEEMKRVIFYGWEENGLLVGVMGTEPVKDVTLIRHAYVLPAWQAKGIGSRLLKNLVTLAKTERLLVGTWEDARWAVEFYIRHGFRLTTAEDKDRLLRTYWDIPERQIEASVVLEKI